MGDEFGFAFQIGQYVTLKAHVELYGLAKVAPLVVHQRLYVECEGQHFRQYDCRAVSPPNGKMSWYAGERGCASFLASDCDGRLRFSESELISLDIEAYKAARVDPLDALANMTNKALAK